MEYLLWTPLMLMNARIFEREIINFTVADLQRDVKDKSRFELIKENKLRSIYRCVNVLKMRNYPDVFTNELLKLKDLRNRAIHRQDRFDSKQAIANFRQVLEYVCWMYNFSFQGRY